MATFRLLMPGRKADKSGILLVPFSGMYALRRVVRWSVFFLCNQSYFFCWFFHPNSSRNLDT